MPSNNPTIATHSPRRPRFPKPLSLTLPLPAYNVPPPVLLAVATLSLAALRHLVPTIAPLSLRTVTKKLRTLLPRRSPTAPPTLSTPTDHITRLDALRDRSIAEINALQPLPEQYATLAPIQRRALLASALERAYDAPPPRPPSATPPPPSAVRANDTIVANKPPGRVATFWNAVEQINGRAAALGFVLCLAREVAEPAHPSLFEQVVDVVVPIAQHTPPFLVAVVDRLVDLVT